MDFYGEYQGQSLIGDGVLRFHVLLQIARVRGAIVALIAFVPSNVQMYGVDVYIECR